MSKEYRTLADPPPAEPAPAPAPEPVAAAEPAPAPPTSIGVDLISAERRRQVEDEGHTAESDKFNRPGTLGMAAICYATFACMSPGIRAGMRKEVGGPRYWPWHAKYWKPGADDSRESRIRELTKAGALIAAEIDYVAAAPEDMFAAPPSPIITPH